MKHLFKFLAFAIAFAASTAAHAQNTTLTNHAFAIGKGPGVSGFTSLLCTSAQLAVGQAAADPICKTVTGDVTISAAGVTAIGATKVTSAMLNADVFSTAHSWAGQQTFVAPILGAATATTINGNTFTTGTYTLTGAAAKTLTFNNSLTFAGTDATTQTFPATSGAVVTSVTPAGGGLAGTYPNPTVASVPASALPNPSATTLGGVQSLAAVASRWINTISTTGVPSVTQPAFTDISGQATLAQLPTIGANTVLGSIAGGAPIALTTAQHTSLVNAFTTTLNGAVPNPGTVASKFLRDDGTWQAVAGAGTVTSVVCGTGLSGGTITASGTCAVALPYFSANLSANQTVTSGTATVLSANTSILDSNSWYNNATFRYTPQLAGKYRVHAQIVCATSSATMTLCTAAILKNGSSYAGTTNVITTTQTALSVDAIISMNGTTDFIQGQGQTNCSGPPCLFVGGTAPIQSYVEAQYVSP